MHTNYIHAIQEVGSLSKGSLLFNVAGQKLSVLLQVVLFFCMCSCY